MLPLGYLKIRQNTGKQHLAESKLGSEHNDKIYPLRSRHIALANQPLVPYASASWIRFAGVSQLCYTKHPDKLTAVYVGLLQMSLPIGD